MKLYPLSAYTGELIKGDHGDVFPGVYRLQAVDGSGGFQKLRRLLGDDIEGVLYIGESKELPYRVGSLKKSVSTAYAKLSPTLYGNLGYDDVSCHQTGPKILGIASFVERFPFSQLVVTVERSDSHYQREGDLLQEYRTKFGENPPLND